MPKLRTIEAFQGWITAPENVESVFESVSRLGSLQKASVALKRPYTLLRDFINADPKLGEKLAEARAAYGEAQYHEAREIADDVKPEIPEVQKAKLRVDVRMQGAKAYAREIFGDKVSVEQTKRVVLRYRFVDRPHGEAQDAEIVPPDAPKPLPAPASAE